MEHLSISLEVHTTTCQLRKGTRPALFQPTKVQKVIENNMTYFRQVRERHIFSNKISNKTQKNTTFPPPPKKKHSFSSIQKVFHLFVPLLLDLLLLGWFTPYHAKSRLDATALGIIWNRPNKPVQTTRSPLSKMSIDSSLLRSCGTVDGRNPVPPGMYKAL